MVPDALQPRKLREIVTVLEGPQSAFFRMVVSYWDMAAALVNHGTIEEGFFNDVNVEHVGTFAKVEPFVVELRAALGNPDFLIQLERLVMRVPNAEARLAAVRKQSREAGAPATAAAPDLASPLAVRRLRASRPGRVATAAAGLRSLSGHRRLAGVRRRSVRLRAGWAKQGAAHTSRSGRASTGHRCSPGASSRYRWRCPGRGRCPRPRPLS